MAERLQDFAERLRWLDPVASLGVAHGSGDDRRVGHWVIQSLPHVQDAEHGHVLGCLSQCVEHALHPLLLDALVLPVGTYARPLQHRVPTGGAPRATAPVRTTLRPVNFGAPLCEWCAR